VDFSKELDFSNKSGDLVAEERLQRLLEGLKSLRQNNDTAAALSLLATLICDTLGFGLCVVSVLDCDDLFRTRAVGQNSLYHDRDVFEEYTLPRETFEIIAESAAWHGDVLWLEGFSEVLQDPRVMPYIIVHKPTKPGGPWHPSSLLISTIYSSQGEITGFISLDDPLSGEIPTTLDFLTLQLCSQVAATLLEVDKLRSASREEMAEITHQRTQIARLLQASSAIGKATQVESVLKTIVNAMGSSGGFQRVVLYLYDDATRELAAVAFFGLNDEDRDRLASNPVPYSSFTELMQPQFKLSRSYLYDHSRAGYTPKVISSLSIPLRPDEDIGEDHWQPLDTLTIPLQAENGDLLGVISVDEPENSLIPSLEHIVALECFADQCSYALQRARQNQELTVRASTDPLTGLLNRNASLQEITALIGQATERGEEGALLFMDLDHFKDINDRYGHIVGDNVLEAVGVALRSSLRSGDVVGRYGGEEFVAYLPGQDTASAIKVAEKLRDEISQLVFTPELGTFSPFRVTMTIGLATVSQVVLFTPARLQDSELCNLLIYSADSALYRGKTSGRNRVVPFSN
jgi:diguanylate cyclase (GGDEF)-like protein